MRSARSFETLPTTISWAFETYLSVEALSSVYDQHIIMLYCGCFEGASKN